MSTQKTELHANDDFEKRVLNAIANTSSEFSDRIDSLTRQVSDLKLDLEERQAVIEGFKASNSTCILDVNLALENSILARDIFRTKEDKRDMQAAQGRLCQSLYFASIGSRREQVTTAHKNTFTWVLDSEPWVDSLWDSFTPWLQQPDSVRPMYWISGKPGSGKSTLMRYLQEGISVTDYKRWTGSRNLWQGAHFFWQAGTEMERSLRGALQSLLRQLLSDHPWLIEIVVDAPRWTAACMAEYQPTWTLTELEATLQAAIFRLSKTWYVLLLIDGLDEIAGPDSAREAALEVFKNLAALPGVKLCMSSRPWNMFLDTFKDTPKLHLQDLTKGDIDRFVREQLESSLQLQHSFLRNSGDVDRLIEVIIEKASGVFLWVRLVVQELRAGLRDGDSIRKLRRVLDSIPSDLDEYFKRMVLSIDPGHRREGSAVLQTMVFAVQDNTTLWPQRLLDLYHLEEEDGAFPLQPDFNFGELFDPFDKEGIEYLVDLMNRRLNSRCMCLLEVWPVPTKNPDEVECVFGPRAQFLHRSLLDFLGSPSARELLENLTGGPFPARLFLCSALLIRAVTYGTMVARSLNHAQKLKNTIRMAAMLDRSMTAFASLSEDHDLLMDEVWDRLLEVTQPLFKKVFEYSDRFESEMDLICILWESRDIYQGTRLAKIVNNPGIYKDSMYRVARKYGLRKRPPRHQPGPQKRKRKRKTYRSEHESSDSSG